MAMQLSKLAFLLFCGSVFGASSATSSASGTPKTSHIYTASTVFNGLSELEVALAEAASSHRSRPSLRSRAKPNARAQGPARSSEGEPKAHRTFFKKAECPWLDRTRTGCTDTAKNGPERTSACAQPTAHADLLQCLDGSLCQGWSCCASRGGRARCPAASPLMCQEASCGANNTEHCCMTDCKDYGGMRRCHSKKSLQKRPTDGASTPFDSLAGLESVLSRRVTDLHLRSTTTSTTTAATRLRVVLGADSLFDFSSSITANNSAEPVSTARLVTLKKDTARLRAQATEHQMNQSGPFDALAELEAALASQARGLKLRRSSTLTTTVITRVRILPGADTVLDGAGAGEAASGLTRAAEAKTAASAHGEAVLSRRMRRLQLRGPATTTTTSTQPMHVLDGAVDRFNSSIVHNVTDDTDGPSLQELKERLKRTAAPSTHDALADLEATLAQRLQTLRLPALGARGASVA